MYTNLNIINIRCVNRGAGLNVILKIEFNHTIVKEFRVFL